MCGPLALVYGLGHVPALVPGGALLPTKHSTHTVTCSPGCLWGGRRGGVWGVAEGWLVDLVVFAGYDGLFLRVVGASCEPLLPERGDAAGSRQHHCSGRGGKWGLSAEQSASIRLGHVSAGAADAAFMHHD